MEDFKKICYKYLNASRHYLIPNLRPKSDYCAVFVDNRRLPHVEFVLRCTYSHLSDRWSALIIAGPENFQYMKRMAQNIHPNIRVIEMRGINNVNKLMTSSRFWNLLHAKKILLFQHDSLLFRDGIDQFLDYDYVGAPWEEKYKDIPPRNDVRVGNGGLSIRDVRLSKFIIYNFPFKEGIEDVYFSNHMKRIGNIPDVETASRFSSEPIWNDECIGMHKMWVRMKEWTSVLENILQQNEQQHLGRKVSVLQRA